MYGASKAAELQCSLSEPQMSNTSLSSCLTLRTQQETPLNRSSNMRARLEPETLSSLSLVFLPSSSTFSAGCRSNTLFQSFICSLSGPSIRQRQDNRSPVVLLPWRGAALRQESDPVSTSTSSLVHV